MRPRRASSNGAHNSHGEGDSEALVRAAVREFGAFHVATNNGTENFCASLLMPRPA